MKKTILTAVAALVAASATLPAQAATFLSPERERRQDAASPWEKVASVSALRGTGFRGACAGLYVTPGDGYAEFSNWHEARK